MAVLLEFQLKDLPELKARFGDAVVTKALNRTLDRMQSKAATLVSSDLRGFYNIQAARIKQDLSLKREYLGGHPSRILLYAGERIGMTRFAGTVRKVEVDAVSKLGKRFRTTRTAAYAKVTKGGARFRAKSRRTHLWAFPIMGRSGESDRRENYHFVTRAKAGSDQAERKSGLDDALQGPSVPQMVNRKAVHKLNAMLSVEMPAEFNRNMAFYLGKQVGLY